MCTSSNAVVRSANTNVSVIAQYDSVSPGEEMWVGFLMEMDDEWHTYWRNPGDSGYPTMINWTLPEGFEAGEIHWPYPQQLMMDVLTTYGYEGRTFLLSKIKVNENAPIGGSATIQADMNWLACRIACIPGTGTFQIELPISNSSQPNTDFDKVYREFIDKYPFKNQSWSVTGSEDADNIILHLNHLKLPALKSLAYYPYERGLIAHSDPQILTRRDDGYALKVQKSPLLTKPRLERINGLIVLQNGRTNLKHSFEIDIKTEVMSVIHPQDGSLLWAILFAFAGGLILNLMPCVLPVLSIKVLALVESAGQSRQKALMGGLSFTCGILVAFWFLAFFIVALKAAGQHVGWGFQFQSPIFLVFMSVLFFWLGLNLFGIFEVGTQLTRVENIVQNSFLLKHSFFNGILATVVATPCTAPFMGSALGYALFKPPIYAYMIFTALGLGLAFPYLTLAIFPELLRFVPKPGPWMLILKKIFALLFMATVIWLSWVLGAQKGLEAIVSLYGGLIVITIAAWVIGRWATVGHDNSVRWKARIIAVLFFLCGFGFALKGTTIENQTPIVQSTSGLIQWQDYSSELVSELRAKRIPIFIDFTAKWCLSCQVNDRVALETREVAEKLKSKGIVPIKADWTNYDEEISKALAAYGKNSIPVYVLYGTNPSAKPVFLPELLTPRIVLDALNKI